MGSPPGPVAGGAPRVWRASLHIAYVTQSRLATRTASSNSPSACACHLDVVTRLSIPWSKVWGIKSFYATPRD